MNRGELFVADKPVALPVYVVVPLSDRVVKSPVPTLYFVVGLEAAVIVKPVMVTPLAGVMVIDPPFVYS